MAHRLLLGARSRARKPAEQSKRQEEMKVTVHGPKLRFCRGRNPSSDPAVVQGMLSLFMRLTILVALGLVALFVVTWLAVHIVVPALIIAALVIGVLFLINLFRRRPASAQITRYRP
jgi:Flp pilus assembly protein TadB